MNVLAYFMLGFAPGVFWLWLIYQRDRYIPAPPFLVVRTFLWGVAASLPVVIVEGILQAAGGLALEEGIPDEPTDLASIAYVSFIVAGFTEEAAKYLVVRRTIYPSPYFRQPLDGIIFGAAAALGFASIENVFYMFRYGPAVILVRGPFSTLVHVFFSVAWGYALGRQKQGKGSGFLVTGSLLASMLLHGLFDFFLFLREPMFGAWAFLLFGATGGAFIWLIARARRESPFRSKVAQLTVACPSCGHAAGPAHSYCTACGASLARARSDGRFACSACGQPAPAGHRFCTSCGSRLERRRPAGV
ncbi:MAG: PrsW family intramembrane metalloprotease [Chloroflexi bacterium]|nr:PrsW family intramembrane metalloprotease [Chloroflexota bacterium]